MSTLWKKWLSVRILEGPVRNLEGPIRILEAPVRILEGPKIPPRPPAKLSSLKLQFWENDKIYPCIQNTCNIVIYTYLTII